MGKKKSGGGVKKARKKEGNGNTAQELWHFHPQNVQGGTGGLGAGRTLLPELDSKENTAKISLKGKSPGAEKPERSKPEKISSSLASRDSLLPHQKRHRKTPKTPVSSWAGGKLPGEQQQSTNLDTIL